MPTTADPYTEAAYRARYVHEKFAVASIAAALRRTKGGIHAAARALRCSRNTLRRYVQEYPTLQEVIENERQLAVDLAEQSLYVCAAAGAPWAVQYLLSTQGRDRGYLTRREVTSANAPPVSGGESYQTVIMIDGNKEQYLAGLRQMREYARAMQGAPPVRPDALPAGGQGNGGGDAG